MVKLVYVGHQGDRTEVEADVGETVMAAAVRHRVAGIEGACGGAMACATCHIYVSEDWFSRIPPAEPAEADMLEYGSHIQPNSRLGCQIIVTEDMNGLEVETPVEQG